MSKDKFDKKIVEELANENYSAWISKVRKVLHDADSPLSLKNSTWTVAERKQMWQELGPRLFDDKLESFKRIAVKVLKEPDPKFELDPDDRFAASIYGKELEYSGTLRKGLAESLALLGTQPDALTNCSFGKAEATAVLSVREIFADANCILWGSLNNLLPTLAEAAPDEFLDAVENALRNTPCPFDELLSQEGDGFLGTNYMTGLLWGLEALAWDEEYLVRVTVILGKLAQLGRGWNSGNRPDNSLTTIFLPWKPQTITPVKKRIVAVKNLQKDCPAIAWKLLLNMLPSGHQTSSGSCKPIWRQTIPEDWEKGVTNKDYREQIFSYAEIVVETAKGDFDKISELISDLDHLPEPSFDKFLNYLESSEITESSEENRTHLWAALEKFTVHHRKYAEAKWALGSEVVEIIEQVANNLIPRKPKNLYRRLFDEGAFELYEEKGNYQEQEQKLDRRRQSAIREIIADGGLKAVLKFAETVGYPQDVGTSLGIVAEDKIDSDILPDLLETEDGKIDLLVHGFIWSRQYEKKWKWVDSIDTSGWSKTQIGKFLTCLPFKNETWQCVERLLGESEIEYWNVAKARPYPEDDLELAIDKLIKYNRPNDAIHCLRRMLHNKKQLDKAKAVDALLKAVSSDEPANSMKVYEIVEIIKALQDDPETNQDDLFSIEWAYVPLLTGPGKSGSPKLLEQKLAADPDFFCEAIRLLYRSKNETESDKKPTEQQQAIAINAGRLVREWSTIPGMQLDGTFCADKFNSWLESVKTKCKESGHLEVALITIGQALVHFIPDPDGLWIHAALAEALNAEDADDIRHGFSVGIYNSRGVQWIDPTGKPEKDLAAKYRQQADEVEAATYSKFAITLRGLAKSYERDAERIIEEHKDN